MKYIICLITWILFFSPLQAQHKSIIVSKDQQGNYNKIQDAINAIPDNNKDTIIIEIKPGVYKEKIHIPISKNLIKLLGTDVQNTIITYDDYAQKKDSTGKQIGTSGSYTVLIDATDFTAENITFENSAGPIGQAVAVKTNNDRQKFKNCRFLGFQDTLYANGSNCRQYFDHCYIEGTVDFIFGNATAWFEQCNIKGKNAGYYTAASTLDSVKNGYIFHKCILTAEAADNNFDLGRPWRPYAKVVFLECTIPAAVRPIGWNN
ncbi:pectinesterase family protein [Rhizosphaericola mali]|uniref:Pectinesterase n=1 Tax=Rhizosphaericola mali TaxID=2545455 RepID=A0A5P2FZZ6_9BACT|nr:pectinesterase family protein [Rhizosphaericola mali]QES88805.1 pectin esterase [Rhizosphaericola mali]